MGSGVIRYSPRSFVTLVICGTWSAGLVAVTVTPGSTAPLSSLTWPIMLASCALALSASATRQKTTFRTKRNQRLYPCNGRGIRRPPKGDGPIRTTDEGYALMNDGRQVRRHREAGTTGDNARFHRGRAKYAARPRGCQQT